MEKITSITGFEQKKYDRLVSKKTQEIKVTPNEELKKLALHQPVIFEVVFWRRVKKAGSLLKKIISFLKKKNG